MCQILVVDDDEHIRELVQEILTLEGYQVDQAANGAEALARLLTAPPDGVLLDMRMPVMDGPTLVRELRDREIVVGVAVMTAAVDAAKLASQLEVPHYLAKPFSVDELLATVESLCADSSLNPSCRHVTPA